MIRPISHMAGAHGLRALRMKRFLAVAIAVGMALMLSGCPATFMSKKTPDKPVPVAKAPQPAATKPEPATAKVARVEPAPATTPVAPPPAAAKKPAPLTLSQIHTGSKPPIKIAILVPLSGQYQQLGNDLLHAAYLALFDLNDKQIVLLPGDTKGTAAGAAAVAQAALQEGAEIIIGPVFSKSVSAVRAVAARRQVNVLAFSTDRAVAGGGVYLLGLTPAQQIERVADFASRNGLQKFAILAPQSSYGDSIIGHMQSASQRHSIEITDITRYPADIDPSSEDLHDIVKGLARYDQRRWALKQEIKKLGKPNDSESKRRLAQLEKRDTLGELPFNALLLPEGGDRLKAIGPLLSYYDVDPEQIKFIGTGLWADRSLGSEPALVGGWFAAPPPLNSKQFENRYRQLYGTLPVRIASLAYDATALAGVLASEPSGPDFGKANIESPVGFSGYDGIFRFPQSGIAERGLAILEIGRNELKVIDPAPENFDALIN